MRSTRFGISSLKFSRQESTARSFIWPIASTSYCELLSKPPCLSQSMGIHRRGAKSRATVSIKDLPQHALETGQAMLATDDNTPAYPMMIQQARNNMEKFKDCVLLTRVGNFYEAGLTIYLVSYGVTDSRCRCILSMLRSLGHF